MRKSKRLLDLAVIAVLVCCPSAGRAQLTYQVVDLGTLGGTMAVGGAINQSGRVAGTSFLLNDQVQNAFLTGPDGALPLRNLGTLGGTQSFAQAINGASRVAGTTFTMGDVAYHAFLSAAGGGALGDLGTLGGINSYGSGVNGAGQAAGYSQVAGGATRAFLSGANGGTLTSLGVLPGGASSFGFAVNSNGQVTGYSGTASGFNHAFISAANGGALRDLGTLGGRYSFATAINDAGQVVGRSEIAVVGQHAFRSGPNGGALTDLGTLGGLSSFGEAINSAGTVSGYSYLSDNSTQHAFVYTTARGMQDLNNLLVPGSGGWTLVDARGINDRGQITGQGAISGEMHAFLLMPVAVNLRITSIARLPNRHVVVIGVGAASQTYSVQAASDLLGEFIQLATIVAASDGTLQFEDTDAANFSRRFYRFVLP